MRVLYVCVCVLCVLCVCTLYSDEQNYRSIP